MSDDFVSVITKKNPLERMRKKKLIKKKTPYPNYEHIEDSKRDKR